MSINIKISNPENSFVYSINPSQPRQAHRRFAIHTFIPHSSMPGANGISSSRFHPFTPSLSRMKEPTRKQIFHEIEKQNWEKVEELIDFNYFKVNFKGKPYLIYDVNYENTAKTPLLHRIIEHKKNKLALKLLSMGANPFARDSQNNTSMHRAAKYGLLEVIKVLVFDFSAPINELNSEESTPLHIAAANGHYEIVDFLLTTAKLHYEGYPITNNFLYASQLNRKESTPLHLAAQNNHGAAAALLIEYGANIFAQDDNGLTPLHLAASNGNLGLVFRLVKEGGTMNVDHLTKSHRTPLYLAIQNEQLEIAKYLLLADADPHLRDVHGLSPFDLILASKNSDMIRKFIYFLGQSHVKHQNSEGLTPLHRACQKRNYSAAKYLLEHTGNDLSIVDNKGNSPLHIAAQHNQKEITILLLYYGCNPNYPNYMGNTSLHLAFKNKYYSVARVLINSRANFNVENADGITPLKVLLKNLGPEGVKEYLCNPQKLQEIFR